jgi:hypothetical protein
MNPSTRPPTLDEMAEAARSIIDAEGYIRIARPLVPVTEAEAEDTMRRFYEVAERLDLPVERIGESLTIFAEDVTELRKEELRMHWLAPMN